jgi:hypothetical protein
MTTSAANRGSPDNDVTPDCVLQFGRTHGLVAEAKLGLPKDSGGWDKDIAQLEKYDDDLSGWWTSDEKLPMHDLVALVPLLGRCSSVTEWNAGWSRVSGHSSAG